MRRLACTSVVLSLLAAAPAAANTYTVAVKTDNFPGVAANCTPDPNPNCSLRDATAAANLNAGPDTITLRPVPTS